MEIFNKLQKICNCKKDVNLKNLCSIHIGGVGACVCYPHTIGQVKKLVKILNKKHIKYYVLGNGTNIVFEDGGVSAVLICLKELKDFCVRKNTIIACAGLNLFALNYLCKTKELEGLEWSYGIPASIGGAVFMNAGAYGHEMGEYVRNVWVLKNGKVKKLSNKQMGFEYRKTLLKGTNEIILKVKFCLNKGDSNNIDAKQKQIFAYRKCCQPYGTYNAGSIFKKTCLGSAGKTIDKLGLKGAKIGDIQISNVHANFFINLGSATSADLHKLINQTKQIVYNSTGIILEEEIEFFPTEQKE